MSDSLSLVILFLVITVPYGLLFLYTIANKKLPKQARTQAVREELDLSWMLANEPRSYWLWHGSCSKRTHV